MSQAKVDRYKEYKANRKEIIAKQKRKQQMTKIVIWVVAILLVCGVVGFGVYAGIQAREDFYNSIPDYTATGQLFSDMVGIFAEDETEDESESESEGAEDESEPESDTEETEAESETGSEE